MNDRPLGDKRTVLFALALILAVTFAAYSPTFLNGFTNWDDPIMVTRNPLITSLSWQNIGTMFGTVYERYYNPLVLLMYSVERHFFGLDPLVFHATSLFLHLLNVLLVFYFIYLLSGSALVSLVTAALFGVHPMHVESVAWISARKDVLYSLFFLGSLVYYLLSGGKHDRHYYLSVLAFLLSLLSKSMAVTLPFILLLCDHLRGERVSVRSLLDKWPFFALSFLFFLVAVFGHYMPGTDAGGFSFSILGGLMAATSGIVFYLIKLIFPYNLSCIYPPPVILISPLIVIALVALMVWSMRLTRKVFFGGMFFLVAIAPVIQFVPVGLGVPADRYTYIPYIGLFYLLAELVSYVCSRSGRRLAIGLIALLIVFLSVLTFQKVRVWNNGVALWEDALRAQGDIALAYYNLGDEYLNGRGDLENAAKYFDRAIEIDPGYVSAYVNRGLIYDVGGEHERSVAEYDRAIAMMPAMPQAYFNRGTAYFNMGKYEAALADYERATALDRGYGKAWMAMGNVNLRLKKRDDAFDDFAKAAALLPNVPEPYIEMALLLYGKGAYGAALKCLDKAMDLGGEVDPDLYSEVLKRSGAAR